MTDSEYTLPSSFRAKVDRDQSRCWHIGNFGSVGTDLGPEDFPLLSGKQYVTFEIIMLDEDMQLEQIRRLIRGCGLLLPDLAETLAFHRAHPRARLAQVISLCGRSSRLGKNIPQAPLKSGFSYAVSWSHLSLFWREREIPFFERDRLLVVRRR
jgi:hypothetical protein